VKKNINIFRYTSICTMEPCGITYMVNSSTYASWKKFHINYQLQWKLFNKTLNLLRFCPEVHRLASSSSYSRSKYDSHCTFLLDVEASQISNNQSDPTQTYINMQFALTINKNLIVNTIFQNNTYTYRTRRSVVVILLPSKDATFL
jgi:hypothetical protein